MDATTKLPVVYIVDDNESVLRALARLVRAGGFLPKPYTSPESFLHEFAAESPACVLLNIREVDSAFRRRIESSTL